MNSGHEFFVPGAPFANNVYNGAISYGVLAESVIQWSLAQQVSARVFPR